MAITLATAAETAAENGAADAVADLFDVGSAAAGGQIVLYTASDVEVARCIGQNPFFGDASSGTATQNGDAVDNDAAGHADPVTNFGAEDRDGTEILTGSVGESGEDMNIDDGTVDGSVVIDTNAVVTLSSIQLTFSLA